MKMDEPKRKPGRPRNDARLRAVPIQITLPPHAAKWATSAGEPSVARAIRQIMIVLAERAGFVRESNPYETEPVLIPEIPARRRTRSGGAA